MAAPLLLVASLMALPALSEESPKAAASQERCVELRQFRANGGCRVAIDRSLAWMCVTEAKRGGSTKYDVSFKSEGGAVVKRFSYDRRHDEGWGNHSEVFFIADDAKTNPDLKIGIATGKDSQVVVGKSRYCLPAESAKALKR